MILGVDWCQSCFIANWPLASTTKEVFFKKIVASKLVGGSTLGLQIKESRWPSGKRRQTYYFTLPDVGLNLGKSLKKTQVSPKYDKPDVWMRLLSG